MFTLRKFADIKHHLPPDCWCRQRREFAAGGFDDEWVLHATGPVQLAQLDLAQPDVPGVQLPKGASVFLVLVQEDADIGQLLSPGDDTGTAGLMVLGDLRLVEVIKGVPRIPESRTTGTDKGKRHGDMAVALALAHYASRELNKGPVTAKSRRRRGKKTQGSRWL